MSWMTEKKARELLNIYMSAEKSGDDEKAEAIENQLNKAGWKITVGPDGTTVMKDRKGDGTFNDWFLPRESGVSPYKGSSTTINQSANTRAILISIGIGVGVIGLIMLTIYIAKKKGNARLQQG